MTVCKSALLVLACLFPSVALSLDLTGATKQSERIFKENEQIFDEKMERQRSAWSGQNKIIGKLKNPRYTYCWGIENENARHACLEEPWMTDNQDARKVLLGDCYGMSKSAQSSGLMQVCAYPGKASCSSIKNSDISYSCYSCDGSRRWVATAAAGHIFECF